MVVFTVHSEELERALRAAPEEMRRRLSGVLLQAGVLHENIIKRRQFGPYRGQAYASRLQRRSGALANAYRLGRPSPSSLEMTAGIRSGVKGSEYAKIQEFGGTVRPRRRKYLTVPLPSALTASGVVSGRYRIRESGGKFVTDAGPTFIFRSGSGNLLIAVRKNGKLTPLYVLKKQVEVKPRLGFFDTWQSIERNRIPRWISAAVRRAMERGS